MILKSKTILELKQKGIRAIVFNISHEALKKEKYVKIISELAANGFSIALYQNRNLTSIQDDFKSDGELDLFDIILDYRSSHNYKEIAAKYLLVDSNSVFIADDQYLKLVA